MLSMEGSVVMRLKMQDAAFTTGLAVLFASYYVFNMHYEEGCEITLEFLQRYVILKVAKIS